mmetsp:Transcript_31114/g.43117  ORF Transcript_31114/g.43117 Transcript_31114/m.43117 type:complete len:236 (-) Transcript_31114:1414-2121(-)
MRPHSLPDKPFQEDQARHKTAPLCPTRVHFSRPVFSTQILMSPPDPPEVMYRPQGEKAQHHTLPLCPSRVHFELSLYFRRGMSASGSVTSSSFSLSSRFLNILASLAAPITPISFNFDSISSSVSSSLILGSVSIRGVGIRGVSGKSFSNSSRLESKMDMRTNGSTKARRNRPLMLPSPGILLMVSRMRNLVSLGSKQCAPSRSMLWMACESLEVNLRRSTKDFIWSAPAASTMS